MKRAILLFAVLLSALVLWERSLTTRAEETRDEKSRVGRMVTEEARAALSLSALRLERRGEGVLTYGRVQGRWRCLDHFFAPADVGAIEGLVKGLLDAQGFVVSDKTEEAESYGILGPDALRVSLCGPKVLEDPAGDVQIAFDLGASVPGAGGSFVRQRGSSEIWAIDGDPRASLSQREGLPPLLEPYVVPRDWEGWQNGLVRISVRRSEGSSFVLERRMFELPPEELRAGQVPWRWILAPGPNERDAARLQAHALSLFVQRIPYVEVLDPQTRDEVLANATDELVLETDGGEPLRLLFGRARADGRIPVWNGASKALLAVQSDILELALPELRLFLEESEDNPWDPWLHR